MAVPDADGRLVHAELRLGTATIMLAAQHGDLHYKPSRDVSQVPIGFYVYVPDIDSHYAHAKSAGTDIVSELNATGYGSQEYSALDTEGYYWSFGTYHPSALRHRATRCRKAEAKV